MAIEEEFMPDAEFEAVMADELIEMVFQPVVSLEDERPVGYEAFARGPEGRLHSAAALFHAAAEAGRAVELDELCAHLATRAFRAARTSGLALFVNLNPETLSNEPGDGVAPAYADLMDESDVVVEITERAVTRRPAGLLDAVVDARRRTARIALDDIGVDPASLAAMPLINPDVVKLDPTIIRGATGSVSHVINAVLEDARRRGAQIVAEGVERPEHVATARSLGATFAQGWLFGRPGPLPVTIRPSDQRLARVEPRRVARATPYDVLIQTEAVHPTTAAQLNAMSAQIEDRALGATDPAILVVNIGDLLNLTDDSLIRYAYLNSIGVEVFLVGHGIPFTPGGRVRGIPLADDDPLRRERATLLVGTDYGTGVFGRLRGRGTDGPIYDAGTTDDWDRVIEATLPLVSRVKNEIAARGDDAAPGDAR
ncbi:EAL domain-containing protein [Asanoa sp. NPDC050611]|uniref:EAL domain-containing protein n=1 Tax=Asanoa sp. NPDC050611 TaxID=3157098 RepID=UPI003408F62D